MNSLTHILEHERGFSDLYVMNRLDRPVSGVLILPRTKAMATRFGKCLRERRVIKEYVCRVHGHFPHSQIAFEAPLKIIEPFGGLSAVVKDGKESKTTFELLKHLPDGTSLLKCTLR